MERIFSTERTVFCEKTFYSIHLGKDSLEAVLVFQESDGRTEAVTQSLYAPSKRFIFSQFHFPSFIPPLLEITFQINKLDLSIAKY